MPGQIVLCTGIFFYIWGEKEKVFNMFFVGENPVSTGRKSLGLGLALCRSIVTAHGGRIWVEDNTPHGAVFSFTLPVEEVSEHG